MNKYLEKISLDLGTVAHNVRKVLNETPPAYRTIFSKKYSRLPLADRKRYLSTTLAAAKENLNKGYPVKGAFSSAMLHPTGEPNSILHSVPIL